MRLGHAIARDFPTVVRHAPSWYKEAQRGYKVVLTCFVTHSGGLSNAQVVVVGGSCGCAPVIVGE